MKSAPGGSVQPDSTVVRMLRPSMSTNRMTYSIHLRLNGLSPARLNRAGIAISLSIFLLSPIRARIGRLKSSLRRMDSRPFKSVISTKSFWGLRATSSKSVTLRPGFNDIRFDLEHSNLRLRLVDGAQFAPGYHPCFRLLHSSTIFS